MKPLKPMKYFCLIPFLLLSATCLAQGSYRGKVSDNRHKPLEMVSVSLLTADSTIVGYAYTDSKGTFALEMNPQGTLIAFSSMGYKRVTIPVGEFADGMRIEMQETAIQLKEVKVTSRRIRMNKDTLSYSVSGFKMPQDRTIEDVLKKIPGIEVTGSGIIKYQDKPITKFYIEGMNLLENKYTLGSKNIPAKMVKEVQVLPNHQPVTALRGKSFSDNAALNLTLEEGAQNRIVKLIDLGAGVAQNNGMLWDNRLMAMVFGKKMQNLTMYKNNNTGKDIGSEILPVGKSSGIIKQEEEEGEKDFFGSTVASASGLDQERFLFNRSHLVAVNHLYKPRKDTDLRLQLSALHNKETSDRREESVYLYPEQTVSVSESEHATGQKNRAEGELTYERNGTSIYLKNQLKGSVELNKSLLNMLVNGKALREMRHPQRRLVQDHFEFIKNMGQRTFSLYSVNGYAELPQYLTVTPGLYEDMLNSGTPYAMLKQDAHLTAFTSHTYTYFQHKIAGFYLKYKAGLEYANRRMTSALQADGNPLTTETFTNDFRLEETKPYIEPSLNFKNSFWDMQFSLPVAFCTYSLHYKQPLTDRLTKHNLMPAPRLDLRRELTAFWKVILNSAYTYSTPDIHRLYAGYLFSSYRSASAYDAVITNNRTWANSLRIEYVNPLTGFFASIGGNYNLLRQETLSSYENRESYLSWNQIIHYPFTVQSTGGSAKVSKGFGWSKLLIALGSTYSHSPGKLMLDNRMIDTKLDLISAKLDISMQPCPFWNMEGYSRGSFTRSVLKHEGYEAITNYSFRHGLKMHFIFSKQWRAAWNNTLSHNNRQEGSTYFTDLTITYTHRLFEIQLAAQNLLNHAEHYNRNVSNFLVRENFYTLRPREILLKIYFSF